MPGRLTFPAQRRLRRKWNSTQPMPTASALGTDFAMTAKRQDKGAARLGMAVAVKHFGGSVPRNRIRRMIRESFRLHQHELPGVDLVVSARPRARGARAPSCARAWMHCGIK